MKTFPHLCLVLLIIAYGTVGFVQAQEAPAKINLGDPSLEMVSETVIPIPMEIFLALDKLGTQDWSSRVVAREITLDPNRSRTAILFGLVVSEGFIAVQAQDKEAVHRVGREVLRLATPLGVVKEVEEHANAIVNGAGRGDWALVRQELDRTRETVVLQMKKMRDDQLVNLVSLGGWLGGTEVLAQVLRENYSPEGSDLLNQTDLINHLRNDFDRLPGSAKRGPLFTEISRTLAELSTLMHVDETGVISAQNVERISLAAQNLVAAIYES